MSGNWDAATYDRISDPHERWAVAVLERLDRGTDGTILDAGCGSGRVTELVLRTFPEAAVVAVDASATMLAQARKRLAPFGDRVTYVHGDLTAPIPVDGPVDAVFSNAVFHWIDDHPLLFRNLAEVLRADGQLVAQCGGDGNIACVLEVTCELGADLTSNFATAEDTAARLEAAGFTDIRTWLHPDPADFDTREAFEEYLRTICVRTHLDRLGPDEGDAFVRAVADRFPDRRVDYVRLNIVARKR